MGRPGNAVGGAQSRFLGADFSSRRNILPSPSDLISAPPPHLHPHPPTEHPPQWLQSGTPSPAASQSLPPPPSPPLQTRATPPPPPPSPPTPTPPCSTPRAPPTSPPSSRPPSTQPSYTLSQDSAQRSPTSTSTKPHYPPSPAHRPRSRRADGPTTSATALAACTSSAWAPAAPGGSPRASGAVLRAHRRG